MWRLDAIFGTDSPKGSIMPLKKIILKNPVMLLLYRFEIGAGF